MQLIMAVEEEARIFYLLILFKKMRKVLIFNCSLKQERTADHRAVMDQVRCLITHNVIISSIG